MSCNDDPRAHWVYVHLNTDAQPLYVGCTVNPEFRQATHYRLASWWPQVADVAQLGPMSKRDALDFEAELIRELDPPHNTKGTARDPLNPANRRRVRAAPEQRMVLGTGVVHYCEPWSADGARVRTGCGRVRPASPERMRPDGDPITCGACLRSLTAAVAA